MIATKLISYSQFTSDDLGAALLLLDDTLVVWEIDSVLSGNYRFTGAELIPNRNYDIKYRPAREAESEEE